MTFNPSLPQSSDKIRNFPGDITTNNWPRLQTIISEDHQFNLSAASTDGYHKVAHFVKQTGAFNDGTPAAITAVGQLYTKDVDNTFAVGATTTQQLFYKPGTANAKYGELAISPWSVRAAAVFFWDGLAVQIKSTFNVASVSRSGLGEYVVTFGAVGTPTALLSNNYSVSIFAGQNTSDNGILSYLVRGDYGDRNTVNTLTVQFRTIAGTSTLVDPTYASVVVMGGYAL